MKFRKLIKYGFFGALTAAVEFLAFLLLSNFADIYIAATVSFLLGLVSSFLFNKFIVFKNSKKVKRGEVLQFFMLGILNSQVSSLITYGLSILIAPAIAKIITMVLIAGWNYLLMNYIIFKDQTKK